MTKELTFDFETRSELDLTEVGLDRYSKHPTTQVLMASYAFDDGEIRLWECHKSPIPPEFESALRNPQILKIAWNATFEREMTVQKLGIWVPFEEWRDPMICARALSLPGHLDDATRIMQMAERKDELGKDWIQLFSIPVRTTGLFGVEFKDWESHPREWQQFCEYCIQDTKAERAFWKKYAKVIPESEWQGWFFDQRMNRRGMPVHPMMPAKAFHLAERSKAELEGLLKTKTGLENPNSDVQMKGWVKERGYPWESLRKEFVQMELDNSASPITAECREVLKLRQEASKRSYKKIERLLQVVGEDNQLRYQFKYGAAARTARWAGGDVQTQNLPRPIKQVKKDYQRAIDLILAEDYETIKNNYPSVVGMVTSSLRMMFHAPEGKKIVVCDFGAIENRGLGYLARCEAILDVFRHGRDPYIDFDARMRKIPYEQAWAEYKAGNDANRQNCKPAVLGAGYGLGGGEEIVNEFGDKVRGGLWGYAKNMGIEITRDFAHESVKVFRDTYKEVVQFWYDLEAGFKRALKGEVATVGILKFDRRKMNGGYLVRMHLPSGRCLHYLRARVETEPFQYTDKHTGEQRTRERDVIYYEGIEHSATQDEQGNRLRKSTKWTGSCKTYGGKICENAVQSFCRDLLVNSGLVAESIGFEPFGVWHDELGAVVDDDPWGLGLVDLKWAMQQPPIWAPDFPLAAEGYESRFYKK